MKVTWDDYLLKSREKSLNVSASLYFRIISLHPYVYRNLGLRCYKTEDFVADGDIVINDQIILCQAPTIDFNAKTMKQGRWRNLFCVLLLKAKFGSSQGEIKVFENGPGESGIRTGFWRRFYWDIAETVDFLWDYMHI